MGTPIQVASLVSHDRASGCLNRCYGSHLLLAEVVLDRRVVDYWARARDHCLFLPWPK
jgi:hypothetical protein